VKNWVSKFALSNGFNLHRYNSGCLDGFADEFGPSKHWHLNGLAAHGPFLWLIWFHQRVGKNPLSTAGSDMGKRPSAGGEPSTPPGKSAVSFYHVTTGRSLGMAPLVRLYTPNPADPRARNRLVSTLMTYEVRKPGFKVWVFKRVQRVPLHPAVAAAAAGLADGR
jgi:hypothetical protein